MAITKILQYNSSPTDETDYQAQNEHLQAFINQLNSGAFILAQDDTESVPYIAQGTYIQFGGTVYIVDTEDYTISGSVTSGSTNYIYLTESGDNLVATWTTDISSYSWSTVYGHLTDGTNIVLPYGVYYDGTYYRIGHYGNSYSSIKINKTKDIDLTSTDNPFQIGDDDRENMAFDTNQILVRDGSGGLEDLILNIDGSTNGPVRLGEILPLANPTSGTQTVDGDSGVWTPSRGVYALTFTEEEDAESLYIYLSVDGGSSYTLLTYESSTSSTTSTFAIPAIFCDGSSVKIKVRSFKYATIYTYYDVTVNYLKF